MTDNKHQTVSNEGAKEFPVRETISIAMYMHIHSIARRALTDYKINDIDVLTDNFISSGLFSIDIFFLWKNH
jgi:hypothetical protein